MCNTQIRIYVGIIITVVCVGTSNRRISRRHIGSWDETRRVFWE